MTDKKKYKSYYHKHVRWTKELDTMVFALMESYGIINQSELIRGLVKREYDKLQVNYTIEKIHNAPLTLNEDPKKIIEPTANEYPPNDFVSAHENALGIAGTILTNKGEDNENGSA